MLVEAIVLLLGVPAGFLIAYLANDELISGRNWFKWMIGLSLVLSAYFIFYGNMIIALTLGFVLIVTLISCWKSFDKNWTRRRI